MFLIPNKITKQLCYLACPWNEQRAPRTEVSECALCEPIQA